MAEIRASGIYKSFPGQGQEKIVLQGVDLTVRSGEFVALLGPSGCGKSTLLNILSGLDKDYKGQVTYGKPNPVIGYLFQESRLLPWLTVRENVRFALEQGQPTHRVDEWLDRVGLHGYSNYFPNQLSIGMQHRVALARVLIINPEIMLLDEPFSSLDEITALSMRTEVLELWKGQSTVVLVTHNPLEAVYMADRVLIMTPNARGVVTELDLQGLLPRPRNPEDARLWQISRDAVRLLKSPKPQ